MKDETKADDENVTEESMRLRAETYARAWGKAAAPISFTKVVAGALFGLALYSGFIYWMGIAVDTKARKEAQEAQKQYSVLEKLADIDDNGGLSQVEKLLMLERLNVYKDLYSPGVSGGLDWRVIQSNSNGWGYAEVARINKAIELYRKDHN